MATRRPNVPRATPAAAKAAAARPAATGPGAAADGGDVIRADFGGSRSGAVNAAPAKSSGASSGTPPARTESPAATGTAPARGAEGSRGPSGPAKGKPRPPATPKTRPTPGETGGKAARGAAAAESDGSLDPVPAKAFSGRLLALGVVMIAITILLAPTVKIFLDKRAEIAALQADIAAKQAKQEDLKRQVSRWQDPNYVKQQARDRINMVMPGETGYWVFGSDLPAAQSSGTAGAASAQDPANVPWVDALWESVRRSATD
ncbi:septum formation initiator family protein [Arthrobacter sp. ov118]|uniref:FtsB family cell division protein n=1 Tax=Arthrobacter sp. ov118 TaxID=1761747 RepID=UPI0008E64AC4|nr:septum formation initiator family protein [Arthrobacter sp. ov118]SFU03092.1 Cell division protein FtsB [Arthrobacter sp. ov118]